MGSHRVWASAIALAVAGCGGGESDTASSADTTQSGTGGSSNADSGGATGGASGSAVSDASGEAHAPLPIDATVDLGPDTVHVEPQVIDELLANPAMGWQTFHTTADKDPNLAGLPSGSAYYRFTWKNLEPTHGDYRMQTILDVLAAARAAGQTLMLRIMTAGTGDELYAPDWLAGAGCHVYSYTTPDSAVTQLAPDLDDATCWQLHSDLVTHLATALAGSTDVQVDIGSVGLWGEWHYSGTTPQVPMPTLATKQKVVDLYFTALPDVPKQALIGDVDALGYATGKGAGWRGDCFGDMGFFSATWNHMNDLYKQNVAAAKADAAWQKGAVAWETCYTVSEWLTKGYDAHAIFQYGLDMHGSFVNNKSAVLPSAARADVEWMLKRLGYRLVLRAVDYPKSVSRAAGLPFAMAWENVGVAPPLVDAKLAVRLSGPSVAVIPTSVSIKGMLPGAQAVGETVALPGTLAAGSYDMAVGVVDTKGKAVVRLAIAGRDADGFYPLGKLTVAP